MALMSQLCAEFPRTVAPRRPRSVEPDVAVSGFFPEPLCSMFNQRSDHIRRYNELLWL